jgi:hypothetical protein
MPPFVRLTTYTCGSRKGKPSPIPISCKALAGGKARSPSASATPPTPISSPRLVPANSTAAEAPMASSQPPVVAQCPATADSAPPAAAAASRAVGGAPAVPGGTATGAAAGSKRMGTHVVGLGQAAAVGPVVGAHLLRRSARLRKRPLYLNNARRSRQQNLRW